MRAIFAGAAAAFFLMTVAACTAPPSGEGGPPPSGGALPPPESSVEPGGEPQAGVTSPPVESISPEQPAAGAPATVPIPEAKGWTQPNVPVSRQQKDIDDCYQSATAQVAREAQIDEDRNVLRDERDDLQAMTNLTRQLDYYSERRRRGALFDACMRSKGYTKDED